MSGLLLLGTALTAGGQVLGGIAANEQAKFQAEAAEQQFELQSAIAQQNIEFHQEVGRINAELALREANVQADRVARARERERGSLRAKLAASGVRLSGTPMAVLSQERRDADEETSLIRLSGSIAARRARFEAAVLSRREQVGLVTGGFESQVFQQGAEQRGAFGLISGLGAAAGTTILGVDEGLTR